LFPCFFYKDISFGANRRWSHPQIAINSVINLGSGAQTAQALEDSSGERRRLEHITKQGNSLLRFLLVEAAQVTSRTLPEWRR
jgi:hypothetical protein